MKNIIFILLLALPHFIFTYIMLWVQANRVVVLSDLHIHTHGLVFLPILWSLIIELYVFVQHRQLSLSEKMFKFLIDFSKIFMVFAGVIIVLTLIHSATKYSSVFIGTVLYNFVPGFYAQLLYASFVAFPILVMATKPAR